MEDKTKGDQLLNDADFILEHQSNLPPQLELDIEKQQQQRLHHQEHNDLAKEQHQLNLKQQQQLQMRMLDQQQHQDLIKQHNQYQKENYHPNTDDPFLLGDQGTCLDDVGISSVISQEKQLEMTTGLKGGMPTRSCIICKSVSYQCEHCKNPCCTPCSNYDADEQDESDFPKGRDLESGIILNV